MSERIDYFGVCPHGVPVAVSCESGKYLRASLAEWVKDGLRVTTEADIKDMKPCPDCAATRAANAAVLASVAPKKRKGVRS